MIEYRNLEGVSIEDLHATFSNAFQDYIRSWTFDEFVNYMRRRGYSAKYSAGAFSDGKLVAFVYNAVETDKGLLTAYDCGTGTTKEFRRQGLSDKLFEFCFDMLQKTGVERYILEVLQNNDPAIALYKKWGFEISEDYHYYVFDASKIHTENADIKMGKGPLPLAGQFDHWYEQLPSWQNSLNSIYRDKDIFSCFHARENNETTGLIVLERSTGDLPLLLVNPAYRRKKIASSLVTFACKELRIPSLRVINVPGQCKSMLSFLESFGIEKNGSQFLMEKRFS